MYGKFGLLNVLKKNDTKVRELGGNGILHGELGLLNLLALSLGKRFYGLFNHILHLISSDSGRLCIVERSGVGTGRVNDDNIRFALIFRISLI